MPDAFITFGPWTLRTYTLAVALGVLVGAGVAYRAYARRLPASLGVVVDVYLGALVGGAVLARLVHVLLNWAYFAYNLDEAARLNAGGLDWHGAVIGALIGLALLARWRRAAARDLLDALTPALPLIALTSWFGCWTASCAYGAEVVTMADYPAFAVWEGPDIYGLYAPRFHTQALGMALAAGVLLAALLLMRAERLRYVRFWFALALLSLGMFALGFLRGDYAVTAAGLRLDQWLDLFMLAFSLARLYANARYRLKAD